MFLFFFIEIQGGAQFADVAREFSEDAARSGGNICLVMLSSI